MSINLASHPTTLPLHAIYRALNKSLVPRRMPLPSPLDNGFKYYLHQVPIYFQTVYTCAMTTRLMPQRMPLPSLFHFTRTIKLPTHLNACLFPFQLHTRVSLLIPQTVDFIVPSHQSDAVHMIYHQPLPLLAHD